MVSIQQARGIILYMCDLIKYAQKLHEVGAVIPVL